MWMSFIPTISYILYGRKMRTVQQSITLFPSLLLILLLLLIVIYDCDGTYDETESIIMDCMSTYMLNLLSCPWPMSIRSTKDNYYSIIPSICVRLGDAVDCSIWWCHVDMDDLAHAWQCNDHSWWCRYQYFMSGVMNNALSDDNRTNDNNNSIPSSFFSAAADVSHPWVRHK